MSFMAAPSLLLLGESLLNPKSPPFVLLLSYWYLVCETIPLQSSEQWHHVRCQRDKDKSAMIHELQELTNTWESQPQEHFILIHHIVTWRRHLDSVEAEMRGTYPSLGEWKCLPGGLMDSTNSWFHPFTKYLSGTSSVPGAHIRGCSTKAKCSSI